MALKTVTDFDFGVGKNIQLTHRVSYSPGDVSKTEVDFIVWLMLEQEFRKARRRREIAKQQQRADRRTQHDGTSVEDDDEDDGEEDELERPRPILEQIFNDKLKRAREYAEHVLNEEGKTVFWQNLDDNVRENVVLQLYKSSELFQESAILNVSEIFAKLRSANKFRAQFNVIEKLAQGGFGEVFLVTKKDESNDVKFALKRITPAESILEEIKGAVNESRILKILKGHRNIVKMYDYWLEIENNLSSRDSFDEDEEGPLKFYIQLEYCSPSLDAWKESNYSKGVILENSQILDLALQIFQGLAHIHAHHILHLDINPKNILWKDDTFQQIKIVDFGLAVNATSYESRVGTPCYIAPELPLTHKSDVYSAAITIIEVAKSIYTKVELNEIIQGKHVDIDIIGLKEFLTMALEDDPTKRPSAADIVTGLSVIG